MAWSTPAGGFLSVYSTGYGVSPSTSNLNPEDLSDIMENMDPWDNIVYALAPKRRAALTYHEWPYDTLPTASRSGAIEGSDFYASDLTTPVRTGNWTQIFRFDVGVTGTQAEIQPHGIRNAYAYHIANATKAIAKAIELRLFDCLTNAATTYGSCLTVTPGNPGTGTSGATDAARLMKSFRELMGTTNDATIAINVSGSGTTVGAITMARVDDLLENMNENGSNPEYLVMNPASKRDFTASVRAAAGTGAGLTWNVNASERRVINGVDIYEGELHTLSVLPDRAVQVGTGATTPYGHVWAIQRDKIGIAVLRPIKHVPLAKVGDNVKGMIVGELTCELTHPKGIGTICCVIK